MPFYTIILINAESGKTILKEIQGKLNFARMVLGPGAPEIIQKEEQYEAAMYAKEEYETAEWLEIPYGTW